MSSSSSSPPNTTNQGIHVQRKPRSTSMPPCLKSCMSVNSLVDSLKSCNDSPFDSRGESVSSPAFLPHVAFDKVEIREYERAVSDHPAVTCGPAIGIGWSYQKYPAMDFNEYEENHPPRRVSDQLKMPPHVRLALLKKHGVDEKSLQSTKKEIEQTKKQRRSTMVMMEFEGTQVVVASAVRKFKRLVKISPSSKREQELLWKKAQEQELVNGSSRQVRMESNNEMDHDMKEVQEVETLPVEDEESESMSEEEEDLDWGTG